MRLSTRGTVATMATNNAEMPDTRRIPRRWRLTSIVCSLDECGPAHPEERRDRDQQQQDGPQPPAPDRVIVQQLRPRLVIDVVTEEEFECDRRRDEQRTAAQKACGALGKEGMKKP